MTAAALTSRLLPGSTAPGAAPHLNMIVLMRGLLNHVFTRVYFPDDPANAGDPVLAAVPERRRQSLIATRLTDLDGLHFTFDIHMQGPKETVFLDL